MQISNNIISENRTSSKEFLKRKPVLSKSKNVKLVKKGKEPERFVIMRKSKDGIETLSSQSNQVHTAEDSKLQRMNTCNS